MILLLSLEDREFFRILDAFNNLAYLKLLHGRELLLSGETYLIFEECLKFVLEIDP